MNRHQRTLVALSGTPTDHALVGYARDLARMGLARHYHFVHVRSPAQVVGEQQGEGELLRACESLVAEKFGQPRHGVSASCHVLSGIRVDRLIEFIADQRCDLVLLGHRKGRSGQRSLARRLAMIAPCSVWMLPEGGPATISEVMVPVDFSDHSADSVEVAASVARAARLPRCVVTHVFSDPSVIRYDEHVDEIWRHEQSAFEKFMSPLHLQGVDMEPYFLEGNDIAKTILYAAERAGTDLLVMSTRGRSRAASILLGSVTSQVMMESPVAVLAVKHFGAMLNLFQALKESQFWTHRNPKTN